MECCGSFSNWKTFWNRALVTRRSKDRRLCLVLIHRLAAPCLPLGDDEEQVQFCELEWFGKEGRKPWTWMLK